MANYMPIVQNTCCEYTFTQKRMMMQGELVPLWGVSPEDRGKKGSAFHRSHMSAIRSTPPEHRPTLCVEAPPHPNRVFQP